MNILSKLAVVIVLLLPMVTSADPIVVQIGDEDGFGFGVEADEPFDISVLQTGDGDGTDRWVFGTQVFNLSYDASNLGAITSAYLEVFADGLGYLGIGYLYWDNLLVGALTDGDVGSNPNNFARLDVFDMLSFSSSFDGSNTVSIYTNQNDGWALDYMRLTINCEPFPGGGATGGCFSGPGPFPAPEPGTLALFGIGLAALGLTRRRRKV